MENKKKLVIGIGNLLQTDDGVGVHIINQILDSDRIVPDDTEFFDGGTSGYDLIPIMQGREWIIVIDALKYNDEPGSMYYFEAEKLSKTKESFSQHDFGVKQLLDMLRLMGENPKVEIFGIVPEDIETFDIGLTPKVKASIPKAVEKIFSIVSH